MRNLRLWILVGLLTSLPLAAQTSYILTASPSNVQGIIDRHGLTVVKEIFDGTNCVMLVTSPSASVADTETEVESDLLVAGFEPEQLTSLPELTGLTQPTLTQSSTSILDGLPGRLIFHATASRAFAPVARRLGANTAGCGVCFLSRRQWEEEGRRAGLRVASYVEGFPKALSWGKKVALNVGSVHHGHFFMTPASGSAPSILAP